MKNIRAPRGTQNHLSELATGSCHEDVDEQP